jgi:hypothetical protein
MAGLIVALYAFGCTGEEGNGSKCHKGTHGGMREKREFDVRLCKRPDELIPVSSLIC